MVLWFGGIWGTVAVPACPEGVAAGPEDAASAGRGPVLCMKGLLNAGKEPVGSIP
jgi:hypothetical protein